MFCASGTCARAFRVRMFVCVSMCVCVRVCVSACVYVKWKPCVGAYVCIRIPQCSIWSICSDGLGIKSTTDCGWFFTCKHMNDASLVLCDGNGIY